VRLTSVAIPFTPDAIVLAVRLVPDQAVAVLFKPDQRSWA
jgi:hypothetical protein